VSQPILVDAAGYPPDGGKVQSPARLARLSLVGDIAIYFKPEQWVRHTLSQEYAGPAMVTEEGVKRTAELQRFPGRRESTLAPPHAGAARSNTDQAARCVNPGLMGRRGSLGADRR